MPSLTWRHLLGFPCVRDKEIEDFEDSPLSTPSFFSWRRGHDLALIFRAVTVLLILPGSQLIKKIVHSVYMSFSLKTTSKFYTDNVSLPRSG